MQIYLFGGCILMRKLLRKSIVILFAAVLVCLLSIGISAETDTVTASGTCGDNLTWTLYDDGELVISGTGAMTDWKSSSKTPWNSYDSQIYSLTIGENIASIGDYAFAGFSCMTYVNIPDSVMSIGNFAFSNCKSLTSIDISDGVVIIGSGAFRDCKSLINVTIGNGVTSIGSDAFSYDYNLTNVNISNIKSWCEIEFYNMYSNPLCIAEYLYLNGQLVTELIIPEDVTNICNFAFYNCDSLIRVDIGEGVTSIGERVFYNCDSLIRVDIGEGVTSIGDYAFAQCDDLISANIGNSVKSIGAYAFYMCTNLSNVIIGEGITSIGEYAFEAYVTISTGVNRHTPINVYITSIEAWCKINFKNKESNPLFIGGKLYFNGELATELVIPESVDNISDYALCYCPDNITKVIIYSRTATFGSNTFYIVPTVFEIYAYAGSTAEAYAKANGHTFVALDAAPEPFGLSGVTMTLGSSLSLDFAIDTAKLTGTDNYAEMTIVYADGRSSVTVTVPQSEWTQYSGSVYTAPFKGMAAKQMNDVVTAVFYNAKGQQLTIERSDSIENYAVRMLNGSAASNKKLRTVYVDMLNYGAAAQTQFNYDKANLANRNLTDAHKAWATASVTTTDNRVKGTGYAGSTLTLNNEIQLDFVFTNSAVGGSDYNKLYAIATYTDHYENTKEVRIEGADLVEYNSLLCQVSITGMAVADFRSVVSCTVYNASGVAVATASDSVESYANRNAASLGATVDTIVKFGASSYNYFH